MTRVRVVGAGLAGLSTAVALARANVPVEIADSAAQGGGRCRSYYDPQLGLTIDNGNHLVLSGNDAVSRFRKTIGADPATLTGPPTADYAFANLASGERWTVRVNDGRLPWWLLVPSRRVPGSRLRDYLSFAPLLGRGDQRIDARVPTHGSVWERLLEPVLLAVLNTPVGEGSVALAGRVLRETLCRGGKAMRPLVAEPSLAAAFVDPAVAWLASHGTALSLGRRLRAIGYERDRVASLDWGAGPEPVAPDVAIVLAVPAWVAASLVPGLSVPTDHRAIVNGHFAMPASDGGTITPRPAEVPLLLGLIDGTAQWIFSFPDRISVTVSAAEHLVDMDREALARRFWMDIQRAHGFEAPMPPWQIVKEKRATFAAIPSQDALRPHAATRWRNLFLAGDWTQTGLPATIEGAIRSGEAAARLAQAAMLG